MELATGALAIVGGLALVLRPDGSLLGADPTALEGSPFSDWRIPGALLVVLVGFGFLLAGEAQRRDAPWSRGLSLFAGAGLIAFEITEAVWLGFQPLEAVFAAVGGLVIWLSAKEG